MWRPKSKQNSPSSQPVSPSVENKGTLLPNSTLSQNQESAISENAAGLRQQGTGTGKASPAESDEEVANQVLTDTLSVEGIISSIPEKDEKQKSIQETGVDNIGEANISTENKMISDTLTFYGNPEGVPEEALASKFGKQEVASQVNDSQGVEKSVGQNQAFGRYRLLQELGRGAMGVVYLAEDTELQRQVALKIPSFYSGCSPQIIERFHYEAQAAAKIHHPNICPVYDVGQVDGQHYLTMAYLEGQNLADYLTNQKTLNLPEAVFLVQRLAKAIGEAHRRGVIHRDLKPANIMIDSRGEPIIMDFGLAHLATGSGDRLTQEGQAMGTPAYMSPEQIRGDIQAMSPRSDIFSLGVILFELLTGRLPFEGNLHSVLMRIVTEPPPTLTSVRGDLDPRIDSICSKAMAKHPDDRFATAFDFASALDDCLQTKPIPAATSIVSAPVVGPSMSRHWKALALSLTGLVGIILGTYQGFSGALPPVNNPVLDPPLHQPITTPIKGENPATEIPAIPLPSDFVENNPEQKLPVVTKKLAIQTLEIHLQRKSQVSGYQVLADRNLPLIDGDKVQVHVHLQGSQYVYLYWYDALGRPARLWPEKLSQQQPVSEVWVPDLAEDPQKQKWFVIGSDRGPEFALAFTSETPMTEEEIRNFEDIYLAVGTYHADGRLHTITPGRERALTGIVESPKSKAVRVIEDGKTLMCLLVPSQRYGQLVDISPDKLEKERGLVGQVESAKNVALEIKEFSQFLLERFGTYQGLLFPHE